MAARYVQEKLASAMLYMKQHQGVAMIDTSGFIRRLHGLRQAMQALFYALAQTLKELNTGTHWQIDSFPVAVCHNIRIPSCRSLYPCSSFVDITVFKAMKLDLLERSEVYTDAGILIMNRKTYIKTWRKQT